MGWLPAAELGSTAVVTGASSGIGAALARQLARRGHKVVLVARREERLRALSQELGREFSARGEVLPCDLTSPEQRVRLLERIEALGLRVDVLAHCAGIGSYGRFVGLDPKREVEQVRLMCEATVGLCRALAAPMAQRRAGAILLVASGLGLQPIPGYATYGAAKAFQVAFGEALHIELREANVAVTTLCPGTVDTEFFAANGAQPVERMMPRLLWEQPDDVAEAALRGADRNRRCLVPGRAMHGLLASRRLLPNAVRMRALDRLLAPSG